MLSLKQHKKEVDKTMMNTTERTQEAREDQTESMPVTESRPRWNAAFKIVGVTLIVLAVTTAAVGLYATGGSFTLPPLSW